MSEIAQRIVDTLNNMWRLDDRVTLFMKNCRFETNDAMLAHPTMPFMSLDDHPVKSIGMMSVLNSLLDRTKERVVMDYRNERDKRGSVYFRVITAEKDPDLFRNSLVVQDTDQANAIAHCMLPVHSLRDMIVVRKYDKDADGKVHGRFAIEPEEAVMQNVRDAMAANPGCIGVGTSIKQAGKEPIDHVIVINPDQHDEKDDERKT